VPVLGVFYTDYKTIQYRRPAVFIADQQGVGQECRDGNEWVPLKWDTVSLCICSTLIDGTWQVPTKVAVWLRGQSVHKLIKPKPVTVTSFTGTTGLLLTEKCLPQNTGTYLSASSADGTVQRTFYRGGPEDLGCEHDEKGSHQLYYSEKNKLFFSPCDAAVPNCILPKPIVAWLSGHQSLSQMMGRIPRKCKEQSKFSLDTDEQRRSILWEQDDTSTRHRCWIEDAVPRGYLIIMQSSNFFRSDEPLNKDWETQLDEPLTLDWESQSLFRPSDQVVLPMEVVSEFQHMMDPPVGCQALDVIAQVEDKLYTAYIFKKPTQLLHQALWYPSIKMQCLVFVGLSCTPVLGGQSPVGENLLPANC